MLTGDDHGNGGTAGQFDRYVADSRAGCSVADWECVRSTSYVYPTRRLTDAQAHGLSARRASSSRCTSTGCAEFTPRRRSSCDLRQSSWPASTSRLAEPGRAVTSRTHCVVWSDWAERAEGRARARDPARHELLLLAWRLGAEPARACSPGPASRCASPTPTARSSTSTRPRPSSPTSRASTSPRTSTALLDGALGPRRLLRRLHRQHAHRHTPTTRGPTRSSPRRSARGVPVVSARADARLARRSQRLVVSGA